MLDVSGFHSGSHISCIHVGMLCMDVGILCPMNVIDNSCCPRNACIRNVVHVEFDTNRLTHL